MSSKVICDLCGQEITAGQGRYSLDVNHMGLFLSEDAGSLDLHDLCMSRLDRIMDHCRNGKIARFDEVLQSQET